MEHIIEYNPSSEQWTEIGTKTEARSYNPAASVVSYNDYAKWCE